MNAEINFVLAAFFALTVLFVVMLWVSADALDRLALRFRARARGLRASREAYWTAWGASYADDDRQAKQREEARQMFLELSSTEQERITE